MSIEAKIEALVDAINRQTDAILMLVSVTGVDQATLAPCTSAATGDAAQDPMPVKQAKPKAEATKPAVQEETVKEEKSTEEKSTEEKPTAVTAQDVTLADLIDACKAVQKRVGVERKDEVVAILNKYNAQKVPNVKPEDFAACKADFDALV